MSLAPSRRLRTPPGADDLARFAREVVGVEAAGLAALGRALDGPLGAAFAAAADLALEVPGRLVVTGIGKSGHVARKIAATLASTGTPAHYVHPAEAGHGDLGMITAADAILALSWSGETSELVPIVDHAKRFAVKLIAMTAQADSALGRAADVALVLPAVEEACPIRLAPTTSTAVQLALGDALALALLRLRGFTAEDFRHLHPGGMLGARLRTVADVMHRGERRPLVALGRPMSEAVLEMTRRAFGCVGVVDGEGRLVGIVTDGDLRRHMAADLLARPVEAVMTRAPLTVEPRALASEALRVMNGRGVTSLFAVEDGRPVGVVHIHDLVRAGIV
jgi:arabinose-5-phosphate isomerase